MDSLVYITTVTYICYNPACDEQTTATAYVKKINHCYGVCDERPIVAA